MDRIRRVRFSLDEHPFDRWLADQASRDARALTEQTSRVPFRALQHAFVREVIAPQLPYPPFVQRGAYVRLHRPDEEEGTAFHSDAALGHGPEEENVWVALTPATLHLLPLEDSERLFVGADFDARALALAVPISIDAGEALIFTAGHVHGVPPHRGPRDQITIDFRVTPRINPHAILGCPFEARAVG